MPSGLRRCAEQLFGEDFRDVQLHVSSFPLRMRAVACTIGQDIHFAPGRFDAESPEGLYLLGHELAHVVQQRRGVVRNPHGRGVAVIRDERLEAEADRWARSFVRRVGAGGRASSAAPAGHLGRGTAVQRMQEERPARTIYVLVYDDTVGDDRQDPINNCRFITSAPEDGIYAFGASSVADMVRRLESVGQPIDYLTLCGHGAANVFGMGSGRSGEYQKGKDFAVDALDDLEPQLAALGQVLAADACVLIVACQVAGSDDGENDETSLLALLSEQLPGRYFLGSRSYLAPRTDKSSFWVERAGGLNFKKGAPITINDLQVYRNGEELESSEIEEDLGFEVVDELTQWPASKKRR